MRATCSALRGQHTGVDQPCQPWLPEVLGARRDSKGRACRGDDVHPFSHEACKSSFQDAVARGCVEGGSAPSFRLSFA